MGLLKNSENNPSFVKPIVGHAESVLIYLFICSILSEYSAGENMVVSVLLTKEIVISSKLVK